MSPEGIEFEKIPKTYKLVPPDGGWGYVVTVSMAVMFIVPVTHTLAFGIIYGKFLAELGDEARGTSSGSGVYNTLFCFSGLLANSLFRKYSYRFVGLIGSVIFFFGGLLTTFVTTFWQFTITFSILQGTGYGLMVAATYSSFNEYFTRKKNMMMSIAHALVASVSMLMPYLLRFFKENYGYRGTVLLLCGISLHSVAAMLALQPVQWHLIKVPLSSVEMSMLPSKNDLKEKISFNNVTIDHLPSIEENKNLSCFTKFWNCLSDLLELSLLKNVFYVNIALGVAFSFVTEIMFISLLAMFLSHFGYNSNEVAYFMTVLIIADLLCRIFQAILNALVVVRNRMVVLIANSSIALVRIVFCLAPKDQMWIVILCAMLGFIRCFIQVNGPLVLAEYCQDAKKSFPSAFCLYQALCGITFFVVGQLLSLVAFYTGDLGIQIVLIIVTLFCVISWSIELINKKIKTQFI